MRNYLDILKGRSNLKNKAAVVSFSIGFIPTLLFIITALIPSPLGAIIVEYGTIPSIPLFIVGFFLGIIGLRSAKQNLAIIGIGLCGMWLLWILGSYYVISMGF